MFCLHVKFIELFHGLSAADWHRATFREAVNKPGIMTKGPNGWVLTGNEGDSFVVAEIVMEQEVAWKLFTNAFSREQALESVRIRRSRVLASPILSMPTVMVKYLKKVGK